MNNTRQHIEKAIKSLSRILVCGDQAIQMGIGLTELYIALQEMAAEDNKPEE